MSKPAEILKHISPLIENRVVLELARGSLLRDEITEQIHSFNNYLVQAVDTGDPTWFDPLLDSWANSITQSDLEEEELVVNDFMDQLIEIVNQTIFENCSAEETSLLNTIMLPVYSYIFKKTASIETNRKIQYLSNQLKNARSDIEKLDESKSNFVAVAAHELKTPLTLIDGYTSMLIDVILKENNNELLVYTNGILNGSKRLRAIIEDMLDVSLLENNMLSLNYQPFWLNRIIEFVLLELSPISKDRGISINIQDFDGFRLLNYGDSEKLIQLFKNIISNAIKFTPDGGSICLNGRILPGFIEVLISDTGIGINQEDQTVIFEKFNRLGNIALHSSSKKNFKGGGPGLGLPIAKGIAEAHGGSIWVESSGYSETDFPGSTFHILLPLLDKIPENQINEVNIL